MDSGSNLPSHLDDITATLGRRSRVRHWEDTLVLMAGMMDAPERLIGRILAGSSMRLRRAGISRRPLHSRSAAGRPRGRPAPGRSGPRQPGVAIDADEGVELVGAGTRYRVPGAVKGAGQRVASGVAGHRARQADPERRADLRAVGLRHAALQVLLTMQEEADAYINTFAVASSATPTQLAIKGLIELWRCGDVGGLRQLFQSTRIPGLPAVIAFVLGASGGDDNLQFLTDALLSPGTAEDAQWSIVDSILFFDPGEVTRKTVTKLRENPALHSQAAYIIGKLRVAEPDSDEARFLLSCLKSDRVKTRGVALKSLAQLGVATYRPHCEWIATDAWDKLAKRQGSAPGHPAAQEGGGAEPTAHLCAREPAPDWRRRLAQGPARGAHLAARWQRRNDRRGRGELMQLSYEVSEDVYWRTTGGREGDSYDASERQAKPHGKKEPTNAFRDNSRVLLNSMRSSASTSTAGSAATIPRHWWSLSKEP